LSPHQRLEITWHSTRLPGKGLIAPLRSEVHATSCLQAVGTVQSIISRVGITCPAISIRFLAADAFHGTFSLMLHYSSSQSHTTFDEYNYYYCVLFPRAGIPPRTISSISCNLVANLHSTRAGSDLRGPYRHKARNLPVPAWLGLVFHIKLTWSALQARQHSHWPALAPTLT
jgi:hypothetical protein